ncbi:OprO/OprP family phosphate-selective porin [Methylobacillus gramineus]|uniref:OprO/OprP family phosphate-selective porin n=1 Tax=Methylobacillus gramineus TaxID=755169 RepID=UPI001CFFAAB5|nr:OprO/OprP family phosphate-selective porin [Methylobacillus gramineus]MCB5184308.1 OprO/OprP family phosphate-selective porin [Methylobacillus gramineus]
MNHSHFPRHWSQAFVLVSLALAALPASADPTFSRNDDQFINIGVAARASYKSVKDAAPNGSDRSNDFDLESARLYTNGKLHKYVSFELNTEKDADDRIGILDARLGLEFNEYFNIFIGRFLPPASRASASAPYYPPTFDFPFSEQAPNRLGGRDNGASVWGVLLNQKLKYHIGAFEGRSGSGTSNQSDNLSFSGRLSYNFWDPEPGFYNVASYDGAKDILAVGASYRYQKDGAGTVANAGNYSYWNVDGRLEKAISGGGVVGAEGSYYKYDNDNTQDPNIAKGKGFFVTGSYTFPQEIGIGKIQPKFVYERFENDDTNAVALAGLDRKRYDLGASYLINGSNIRVDAYYYKEKLNQGLPDIDGIAVRFHVAHFF